LRVDSAPISGFLDCRRWPFRKQTAYFVEGSAGFEETTALFLAKYALTNPFMPEKLRAHFALRCCPKNSLGCKMCHRGHFLYYKFYPKFNISCTLGRKITKSAP
jgi:hypothetical protein